MFGSIKIAAIRGIPIRIHFTLLVVFFALVLELGLIGLPAGVLLFASVLAHELGHALIAQRFGISIAGIELHILGGTALMREQPSSPKQEMAIAIAGPAVSLLLGIVFASITMIGGVDLDFDRISPSQLLPYLAAVNFAMAVFNLIPALPMDGGRVLRAALAMRMPTVRATRLAAHVARVFAVLFVGAGLMWGAWTLPLIGVMIFVLSGYEQRLAEAKAAERAAFDLMPPAWRPPRVMTAMPRLRGIIVITTKLH
jgi:Zn-dependent protease